LNKQESFRKAYFNFDIAIITNYDSSDFERLLQDASIIRNKLKINVAIENTKKIIELQTEFGSFKNWLNHHHPKTKEEWVKTFKKTFKFTGGEIVNEFLMSTRYLPNANSFCF
jgi:DNA-3-methyladenine glycosylase I